MAAGTARIGAYFALLAVLLVVASDAGESSKGQRIKKRSVDTTVNRHSDVSDVRVVKKSDSTDSGLSRVKRFKRATSKDDDEEPHLERKKRFKRDSPNSLRNIDTFASDDELQRIKRNKRDSSPELHRYKRQELTDLDHDEPALSRQKRFKRDLKVKPVHFGAKRIKRSGKKIEKAEAGQKRNKREDISKAKITQEGKKHIKKSQSRRMEKRHEAMNKEYPIEIHQKGHLDDIVKKAMVKFKRSKHRSKHSKVSKGHRSKRAGHLGIKESSQMLKDISRDISRLQRLRRGIAKKVIKSVKAHHAEKHH